jgi:hypothetical protein
MTESGAASASQLVAAAPSHHPDAGLNNEREQKAEQHLEGRGETREEIRRAREGLMWDAASQKLRAAIANRRRWFAVAGAPKSTRNKDPRTPHSWSPLVTVGG